MGYYVPLPKRPGGRSPGYVNFIDGGSTAVQRAIRRDGLANYEPPTMAAMLALFEIQATDFTFFDVGANVGLYTLLCSKFFPQANVVAFEPTPSTARITRKLVRVNDSAARVEEMALGAEPGHAQLFLSATSDASNSLVEGFKETLGTVDIAVETLDRYARASGCFPDVMKIDAESFEPQVLAGGHDLLRGHRPALIVEVLNRKGHDHGVEMMEAMEGLDYFFYRCDAYSEWNPEPVIEGATGRDRDWLFSPNPLPSDFAARVEGWEAVLARCTVDRNTTSLPSAMNPDLSTVDPSGAAVETGRSRSSTARLAGRVRRSTRDAWAGVRSRW